MKTLQKFSFTVLFLSVLVGSAHAQRALLSDTLEISKVKQNYLTLRLSGAKVISKNWVATVDLGLASVPKSQSPFPRLTDGRDNFTFGTTTGFINLLDDNGFEFVTMSSDDIYVYLLFRRKRA